MTAGGAAIVLTADRTLMSRHRLLLDGMFVSSQTTTAPRSVVARLFLPPARHVDGRATVAPLGLRRLQAALTRDGFSTDEVAIADEDHLHEVCGPNTRIIGLSGGEPGGYGMSSTTMTAVAGGDIVPRDEFRRLLKRVHRVRKERCPEARLIFGGPGAWQFSQDASLQAQMGLSCVVEGYAEGEAASLLKKLLESPTAPLSATVRCPAADQIPPVLGETTMGAIELSRGCGLGCDFCTIGTLPMLHLPPDTILADAETNLQAGQPNLSLLSEDLLRYGATGLNCAPEALLGLLRQLRALPGLRLLQADHTNISSVAKYDDAQLAELHHLLTGGLQRLPWLNLGIESASGDLVVRLGGRAKMKGLDPSAWGDFCREQLDRLMRLNFVPMVSLVLGSPEETEADTQATLDWVRGLRGHRTMVFPVLHAPLCGPQSRPRLTPLQWQVMREAYEFNFRWMPRVYDDSMKAGGVGMGRRALIQLLGQANVLQWRYLLRKRQREAV